MNKLFTKIVGACLGLTMAVGVGVAVGSNKDAARVNAAAPSAGTKTYSLLFSDIGGTTGWSNSYASHSYTASDDVVISMNASKQTSNITDRPVTKGQPVELKLPSNPGVYISGFTFTAQQWTTKAQTITAHYSTNGGSSYTALTGTSTNFSITKSGLTSGTNAIKITFSSSSNQVGLTSFSVTYTALSQKLDTPSPSYNDTTKQVTWGAVDHASSYQVKVDSGSYATATSPYDVSGLTTGQSHTVYVVAKGTGSYTDSEAGSTTFTPTAPKVFTSISLSGTYPTTFEEGDEFDHTGMTVTAHFDDSSTSDVTASSTFSGYNMSTLGSQTVTVSCTIGSTTKTTTYTITVNEKVVDHYALIKSTSDLTAGSSYLIGNVAGTAFMSTTQNGNNRGKQDPGTAASDDVVEYTVGFEVVTLGGQEGAWTFYTSNPETSASGSIGYLYAASGSSNWLRTQASNNANGQWSIEISNSGEATILAQGTNSRNKIRYNSSNNPPIFSCYASDATTGHAPALWKLIDNSESVALNKSSVSDMKGNTNKEVQITASNFTPTSISATYSVANIASVTAGTISGGTIPLNISCVGVGTTTATITVNGGNGTNTIDLDIEVVQKPASLTLVNSYIDDGEIEVKLGGSRQISFTALDTDLESYQVSYQGKNTGDKSSVTCSSSDDTIVSLSGEANLVLNGESAGDAIVTCTLTATIGWVSPITQTLTVHVIPDYNERNVSITTISGVNVDQGDTLVVADHISSATATTHFGTNSNPISDNELLFSYTNNRSAGVAYSNFVFDVTDPDLDAGDTETRTVYVFVTFNESYAGTSFTVVIEVEDRPVIGLLVDGDPVDPEDEIPLSIPRNSTYDLSEHVTVNPTNATESHQIDYEVVVGEEYVSVSAAGVISTGSKTGNVAYISATSHAHSEFVVYFDITITREAMTITADVPVSGLALATSLEVGDEVIMVNTGDNMELTGVTSDIGTVASYSGTPAGTYVLTVGEGVDGGFTFSNNGNYLAYTGTSTSSNNKLFTINSLDTDTKKQQASWTVTFSETAAELHNVYNSSRYLQYNGNSGQERFCGYTGTQQDVSFYKEQTGSEVQEVTVNDALFNAVNNAMSLKAGSSTLYDLGLCDASGASFNTSAWSTLGYAFTSSIITDNKLAYARSNENGNEIEQFLAVYDYVVSKYGDDYDFLGRIESGKVGVAVKISPIAFINSANNTTITIAIVISLVSVTAIGGYFFLRKRKENI